MFQTFISRHNSNFFSDKLVLTSVTPASSETVLQTTKATSSSLYFDSLTVNAGNGGFLHCIQMDTSVNAANHVVPTRRSSDLRSRAVSTLVSQAIMARWTLILDSRARPKADRKSTRLNSSHRCISYAVFCLKKKKKLHRQLYIMIV